ncbi:DMT family transporter [Roseomonas sp. M0104]|uniref:DMT family transporter n=1 Tax=Teichococcus coralli TaxID=2545983 RepID=A0A845BAZ3_9PROT|nr:DMT family transporter [Pseudoroseomonas coralli]MXP63320.1 DMT family transporter [Pseudoroseomonas coralli]
MTSESRAAALPISPPRPGRERLVGLACALGVLAVWTGFLLSSRFGTRQFLTPWDMAALRYAGSLVVGLVIAAAFGWPRLAPGRCLALMATAAFGYPLLAYWGFRYAPTAHAAVLMTGMLPFAAALLGAVFLGELFPRGRLLSLGVVGGGILLLAADTFGAHPGAWRGDLLFLSACLSWASFTVLIRRWQVPALTATTMLALYPPLIYLPLWWLGLPSEMASASPGAIAYQLVYQGFFAVVVAGFLFTRAVNALGSARTTTITALTPALAALAAGPLLGEWLGWAGLAGVALVSVGMVLGVLGRQR